MNTVQTIGILGGMGPEATNQLCALITSLTPVTRDQDHIPVLTFNNSRIPSRVHAVYRRINGIREDSSEALPEMIRTAQILERAGADFLIMPCNLAHFFLAEIQNEIAIPILNMIEETAKSVVAMRPAVTAIGLLASTPTIKSGLYSTALAASRIAVLVPDSTQQEELVMQAIYASDGIKSGHKIRPRAILSGVAQRLRERGAEVIVSGCTEVSLVMKSLESSFKVIDPLEIIARVAVNRATVNCGHVVSKLNVKGVGQSVSNS